MNITGNGNIVISGVNNSNINIGQTVKKLVEKNNLNEALNEVLTQDNEDTVISLKSRLWKLERDVMLGILSSSEENVERSKITFAILQLCEEINQVQQPKLEQMNKYQNLSKSDVANVLLTYLKDINPTNRPFIAVLQNEVLLAQKELQYSKLQSQLEQLASASVSPNVNNFHDAVFKSNYDGWVKSTIEILTKYIEIIDKHSTNNELPSAALSRLSHTKTMDNLKLWVDSLKRATGSRVKLSDKLVDKLDYWKKYVENLDELEIEIVLDNQIIPDFKLYCNQNEI